MRRLAPCWGTSAIQLSPSRSLMATAVRRTVNVAFAVNAATIAPCLIGFLACIPCIYMFTTLFFAYSDVAPSLLLPRPELGKSHSWWNAVCHEGRLPQGVAFVRKKRVRALAGVQVVQQLRFGCSCQSFLWTFVFKQPGPGPNRAVLNKTWTPSNLRHKPGRLSCRVYSSLGLFMGSGSC